MFAANVIDTDGTLTANSDSRIPTQKAVRSAIAAGPVPVGSVIDSAYATYSANADLTSNIPLDDTVPQITEGTEIVTVTITPKSTTNKLRVRFRGQASSGALAHACAALFVGTTANALAATYSTVGAAASGQPLVLEHEFVPGVTTPVTLRIRVGAHSGTIRMNGSNATRVFQGASAATLVVEEIKV